MGQGLFESGYLWGGVLGEVGCLSQDTCGVGGEVGCLSQDTCGVGGGVR